MVISLEAGSRRLVNSSISPVGRAVMRPQSESLRFGAEEPEKPGKKKKGDEPPSPMEMARKFLLFSTVATLGMIGLGALSPAKNTPPKTAVKAGEMVPDTEKVALLTPKELDDKLRADKVKAIKILSDARWEVQLADDTTQYFMYDPKQPGFEQMRATMLEKGILPYVPDASNSAGLLLNLILLGAPVVIMVMMLRAMRNGPGNLIKNKSLDARQDVTGFDLSKVAGMKEVVDEIRSDVIELFNNPENEVGARRPKGILLEGPPGTGKTLLAKCITGELNRTYFTINGSDFVQMFVGLGASRVRELFQNARKEAPSVIFIDEIDAVGKTRAASGTGMGGNDEREQTLNAILSELDGFNQDDDILVLAATNRKDVLDPALVRAGRFDLSYTINPPLTPEGRRDILNIHIKKNKVADGLDTLEIARQMWPGTSGADIADIVNKAALNATRKKKSQIDREDFLAAIERFNTGLAKEDANFKPEEKRRTAVHETHGHAMVSKALDIPFRYISIVPRSLQSGGTALGMVGLNPDGMPQYHQTREFLERMACMTLAGKAAEEVYYKSPDKVSGGASNDLVRVNDMLKNAIETLALYPELFGLVNIPKSNNPFESENVSPELKARSEQVRRFLLDEFYEMTKAFIAAVPQGAKDKLVEEIEKAETINDPEKLNQLFNNAGVSDWQALWQQATDPVRKQYDAYRETLKKEAKPWKA